MPPRTLCPTCKGPAAPYPENPTHPFCSKRCKLADLSNWFNERYTVPGEATQGEAVPEDGADPRLLH